MNDLLTPPISMQLSRACAILDRHLGGTIIAIHLFGSAVDGGLKPFSDLDLLVTVTEPPTEATRRALMVELLSASAPPRSDPHLRALEVTVIVHSEVAPWRYPPRRELQFGEWLRDALQAGSFEPPMLDHDLAILLTKARRHSVNLRGPIAMDLFQPVPQSDLVRSLQDTIAQWNGPEDWAGDERNIVLTLARIWYSATTHEIASKDAAGSWLLEQLQGTHRAVLSNALAAYRGTAKDDLASRQAEVAAFVRDAKLAIERTLQRA